MVFVGAFFHLALHQLDQVDDIGRLVSMVKDCFEYVDKLELSFSTIGSASSFDLVDTLLH